MGALCSGGDENNSNINNYMNKAQNEDARVFKLLLLGPGATGKSTLFKSLQILHSGSIQPSEKRSIIHFIRQNILNGIITLMEYSLVLPQKDEERYADCEPTGITEDIQNRMEDIKAFKGTTGFVDESKLDYQELAELAASINIIWQLPFIQATWKHRGGNFVFDDNLDYFFANVSTVMTQDYMPSDEDCLKNRIKTSGM